MKAGFSYNTLTIDYLACSTLSTSWITPLAEIASDTVM